MKRRTHTVNHPVLAQLPLAEQKEEIAGCALRLFEELGEPMHWFSYPVGGPEAFNQDTQTCLIEQNVKFAFSYYGGYWRCNDRNLLNIPRLAFTVNPAAAASFRITFPSGITHGVAFTFTVTALDAFGNVATGYRHAFAAMKHY